MHVDQQTTVYAVHVSTACSRFSGGVSCTLPCGPCSCTTARRAAFYVLTIELPSSQHGFLAKRSCLTNLLEFLEYVTKAVKAFDKVSHVRLVNKLERTAEWLQGRQQRVVLNGSVSKWLHVLSGVPQGSILGPLLFIILINDIDNGIVNKLLKFADDAELIGIISSPLEVKELQLDLKKCSVVS